MRFSTWATYKNEKRSQFEWKKLQFLEELHKTLFWTTVKMWLISVPSIGTGPFCHVCDPVLVSEILVFQLDCYIAKISRYVCLYTGPTS